MSTETHHPHAQHAGGEPRHDDVQFEKTDVQPRVIYWYLLLLALAVVVSYAACIFVLRLTTRIAADSDTPPPPVRVEMGKTFQDYPPEPRLQGVPGHTTDPQADLREKIQQDTEANDRFGWVDESAGIAQIPVKDAMKIIAEKGLPGATAPAEKK
jgi:hypothetical protein